MTDVQGKAGDEDSPEQVEAEHARSGAPARSGQTDTAQGVFEDQREIDPQAVSATEMLRTIVTLGCAAFDESLVGQALPASAVIRPHGVELTICHAGSLELALPTVSVREPEAPAASSATVSLDEYRELVWLFGPARLPRAAIVGRALHELGAVREEFAQSHAQVCSRIQQAGGHHLRPEIVRALDLVHTSDDSSKPVRSLAGLLKSAIGCLGGLGWLGLRAMPHGGAYLRGKGVEIFNGFPPWDRIDEPPQPLRRPRANRRHETDITADHYDGMPGSQAPS